MIKLVPGNTERMYHKLVSPRLDTKSIESLLELGFGIKTKVGKMSPPEQQFHVNNIFLPSPLESFKGTFHSDTNNYSGQFLLTFDSKNQDLFSKIKQNFPKLDNLVLFGDNILYLNGKTPYFVLAKDPSWFTLNFGTSGTVERTLSNLEQFETDINHFCSFTTDIINAAYEEETLDIEYSLGF